jgi:thioredoxin-related protein
MKRPKKLVVITLLLFVVLFGCSKLNRENYDKIKVGMDYQQVVSIIGDPDKCDAIMGSKNCVWGNENKNITINFIGDKVFVLSMNGF